MVDLQAILYEVAQALSDTGITVYSVTPDANDFPALVLNPPTEIRYVRTLSGKAEIDLTVTIYTGTADLASAWALLYMLLSYNLSNQTPVPDALYNATPTNYKQLIVNSAGDFRTVNESALAVDVNITITTN